MSFITVEPDSHFPLENLPFGIFSTASNVRSAEFDVLVQRFAVRLEATASRRGHRNEDLRFVSHQTFVRRRLHETSPRCVHKGELVSSIDLVVRLCSVSFVRKLWTISCRWTEFVGKKREQDWENYCPTIVLWSKTIFPSETSNTSFEKTRRISHRFDPRVFVEQQDATMHLPADIGSSLWLSLIWTILVSSRRLHWLLLFERTRH